MPAGDIDMGKLRSHPRGAAAKRTTSIEELARRQGVGPATDLDEIASLWPADHEPGAFLDFIVNERRDRRRINPSNGKRK
jgi:hypothetical protein